MTHVDILKEAPWGRKSFALGGHQVAQQMERSFEAAQQLAQQAVPHAYLKIWRLIGLRNYF